LPTHGAPTHGLVGLRERNGRDIIGPRLHCGGSAAAPSHPKARAISEARGGLFRLVTRETAAGRRTGQYASCRSPLASSNGLSGRRPAPGDFQGLGATPPASARRSDNSPTHQVIKSSSHQVMALHK